MVRGLNHLAGFASADARLEGRNSSQATTPTRSTMQAQVEKRLAAVVSRNHFWKETDTEVCFDTFFLKRKVDYMGEEVKIAQRMTWAAIQESLPDAVGSLPLEKFCRLGTLEYVKNFEKYLVPRGIQVRPKPPRVMRSDLEWPQICAGLVSKGLCEVWPIERLHHIEGQPLLNGMFSVGKGEFKDSLETQRLIMNLVPVNALCKSLTGDVGTLPAISGMSGYLLDQGEVALLSSEDIRCFFYLFAIPEQWKAYKGFNKPVPESLVPAELHGRACVLVSRVLPMGFLNSVSIAQRIHQNVVPVECDVR